MDAYDRAEKARKDARASQVRELDILAVRHGARAALLDHGVCIWFRHDGKEARWTWSFVSHSASVEYSHACPAATSFALEKLSRVLGDAGFFAALGLALDRTSKEQSQALTRARDEQRVEKNRYHGD